MMVVGLLSRWARRDEWELDYRLSVRRVVNDMVVVDVSGVVS